MRKIIYVEHSNQLKIKDHSSQMLQTFQGHICARD